MYLLKITLILLPSLVYSTPTHSCAPIGPIPQHDNKKTVWTCSHDWPAYGEDDLTIPQSVYCFAKCPSFTFADGSAGESDIVVSSSCVWDSMQGRGFWSAAEPANVLDSVGVLIESPTSNPEPSCGCQDLVLNGTIPEEKEKVFDCSDDILVTDDNKTVITAGNECVLMCSRSFVFSLFCFRGMWSVPGIEDASDIVCYEDGGHSGSQATLSTYWPISPEPGS